MVGAVSALVAVSCLATPVSGSQVKAGPFTAFVAPPYDVVDGRFALRVGPYRELTRPMNQKILWLVPGRHRVGAQLALTGRLDGAVQYRARFNKAYVAGSSGHYFPSIVAPPKAGCWTMTLTTGRLKARFVVLVREHEG